MSAAKLKQSHPQTPPKTVSNKDGSGRQDAAARAKDIMARFPRTIARLAK